MSRATHLHQSVRLGARSASGHRRVARVLQRRSAAPGVGLPDAACCFRRHRL